MLNCKIFAFVKLYRKCLTKKSSLSVAVITLDFESSNGSSILPENYFLTSLDSMIPSARIDSSGDPEDSIIGYETQIQIDQHIKKYF